MRIEKANLPHQDKERQDQEHDRKHVDQQKLQHDQLAAREAETRQRVGRSD